MSARLPDWERRLYAFLAERRHVPFTWGDNDCCTFAFDGIGAITGERPALPTGYTSTSEAVPILHAEGGFVQLISKRLGEPIPARMAKRGDVVLVEHEGLFDDMAAGICIGNGFASPGPTGLFIGPASAIRMAWAIGSGVTGEE